MSDEKKPEKPPIVEVVVHREGCPKYDALEKELTSKSAPAEDGKISSGVVTRAFREGYDQINWGGKRTVGQA